MEKRREARYPAGQAAEVTVLSGERFTCPAVLIDGSGSGIAVEMPVAVEPGAALKIEWDDTMLLGEAMHCSPQRGRFVVGVLLETKISQLSRLAQILQAFADEQPEARLRV